MVGFEVDLANELGHVLSRPARLVLCAWDQILSDLDRGTIDIGLNGYEYTPQRPPLPGQPSLLHLRAGPLRAEGRPVDGELGKPPRGGREGPPQAHRRAGRLGRRSLRDGPVRQDVRDRPL